MNTPSNSQLNPQDPMAPLASTTPEELAAYNDWCDGRRESAMLAQTQDGEPMDYERLNEDDWRDEPHGMTDVEADADTLKSAGMGTDEDYMPAEPIDREDGYLDAAYEDRTDPAFFGGE